MLATSRAAGPLSSTAFGGAGVAAAAGAATEFVVEENHGVEMLCNLLLDEIDPEVEVVRGIPRMGITTAAALTQILGRYMVAACRDPENVPVLRVRDLFRALRAIVRTPAPRLG